MKFPKKMITVLGILLLVSVPSLSVLAADEPLGVGSTVRSFAEANMSESGVPGMVFVMVDADGVAVTETFGEAEISSGRPMTPDTPLRLGSISKPVTAALALELAADGKLSLDVPVDDYLDVDLTDRYGRASTLRQLLQHRGGYPDAFLASHHLDAADATGLQEWVLGLSGRSLRPGVVASYSSVGYTLAGAAMEGALGADFAALADANLFEPLGMASATFELPVPGDVAVGYSWDGTSFDPYPLDTTDLVPGAGLTATGNDMALFMQALLTEDSPLSDATRDTLLAPAGPYPGLRSYTTGLTEWRYENRSALYHEGNGIGTVSRLTLLPDEGVAFFTSVNGEALVGAGNPSSQNLFIRDLHQTLVEEFYPGPFGFEDVPVAQGNGQIVDPRPGTYIPTRTDTGSVLRLEALLSQLSVGEGTDGMVFYRDSDGMYYSTKGGTSSFREAFWWEATQVNLALVAGSAVVAIAGTVFALNRARGSLRWLTAITGAMSAGFVALLGYGMANVDAMELFTGTPIFILMAQLAIAGAAIAASALGVSLIASSQKQPASIAAAVVAVVAAAAALTVWSWAWQVFPI